MIKYFALIVILAVLNVSLVFGQAEDKEEEGASGNLSGEPTEEPGRNVTVRVHEEPTEKNDPPGENEELGTTKGPGLNKGPVGDSGSKRNKICKGKKCDKKGRLGKKGEYGKKKRCSKNGGCKKNRRSVFKRIGKNGNSERNFVRRPGN